MNLSERTINIFKNFGKINQNLLVDSNKISTISAIKTILAETEIDENPNFGLRIYDINQFVSLFKLFKDNPSILPNSKFIKLTDGHKNYVNIRQCDEDRMITPKKKISVPKYQYKFKIPEERLKSLQQYSKIAAMPDVLMKPDSDNKISIEIFDKSEFVNNDIEKLQKEYVALDSLTIQNFGHEIRYLDKKYKFFAMFKTEYLNKLMLDDYDVSIFKGRIAKFVGKKNKITYYVALEISSDLDENGSDLKKENKEKQDSIVLKINQLQKKLVELRI